MTGMKRAKGVGLTALQAPGPSSRLLLDDVHEVMELMNPLSSSSTTSFFTIGHIKWSDPTHPNEGAATVLFSGEHRGFAMRVGYTKGKKNGAALVYYPNRNVFMNVHFVDDVEEGGYRFWNADGNVIEEGFVRHGKRHGLVKGTNEVKHHFYNGYKLNEKEGYPGYWEMRENGKLVRVAQMDNELLMLHGRSYEYEGGVLKRESMYEKDERKWIVREWNDTVMIEYYSNGEKQYEGGYEHTLEFEVNRMGYGKVFVNNAIAFYGYWKGGRLLWIDQYRNGVTVNRLTRNAKMSGYWNVISEDGELVSTSQYNITYSVKEGLCYEYANGVLKEKSVFHGDKKTRVLIEWKNGKMVEYHKNGKRSYEGEWKGSMATGFVREGEGSEFGTDGVSVVYKGHWDKGLRSGKGMWFRKGSELPAYSGEWRKGYPNGNGYLKDENGDDLCYGKWENGYLNVRENRWVDFEDGRVTRARDKRQLRNWVVRGGERAPSWKEVIAGSVLYRFCHTATLFVMKWDYSILFLSFVQSILFGKYLSRFGGWGWTCPMWYVVFGLVLLWSRSKDEKEARYFDWNALLNAASIASFHWFPYTISRLTYPKNNGVVLLTTLLLMGAGLLVLLVVESGLAGNAWQRSMPLYPRYYFCHWLPMAGLVVAFEDSEKSRFCLVWGIVVFINCIISCVLLHSGKNRIRLAILWDSVLLLTMALLTRSYSGFEITVSILLIAVSTVIQIV